MLRPCSGRSDWRGPVRPEEAPTSGLFASSCPARRRLHRRRDPGSMLSGIRDPHPPPGILAAALARRGGVMVFASQRRLVGGAAQMPCPRIHARQSTVPFHLSACRRNFPALSNSLCCSCQPASGVVPPSFPKWAAPPKGSCVRHAGTILSETLVSANQSIPGLANPGKGPARAAHMG